VTDPHCDAPLYFEIANGKHSVQQTSDRKEGLFHILLRESNIAINVPIIIITTITITITITMDRCVT
jgi:hypothetical protein